MKRVVARKRERESVCVCWKRQKLTQASEDLNLDKLRPKSRSHSQAAGWSRKGRIKGVKPGMIIYIYKGTSYLVYHRFLEFLLVRSVISSKVTHRRKTQRRKASLLSRNFQYLLNLLVNFTTNICKLFAQIFNPIWFFAVCTLLYNSDSLSDRILLLFLKLSLSFGLMFRNK